MRASQLLTALLLLLITTEYSGKVIGSTVKGKAMWWKPSRNTQVFPSYASDGPVGSEDLLQQQPGPTPVGRFSFNTECTHCSREFAEYLRPGFTLLDLYQAIDQFVLLTLRNYQQENPETNIILYGSYGLYARAAEEYGELNADQWREKAGLGRHGDFDVIVETPRLANDLKDYLIKQFRGDGFRNLVKIDLGIGELFTAQHDQLEGSHPVIGYMIWFTPQGCRHPKKHQLYKMDIGVRTGLKSSSVTFTNFGTGWQSYTFEVGTWEQLLEELKTDNRDGGAKAIARLEALADAELQKYGVASGRLSRIRSLLDEKFQQNEGNKTEPVVTEICAESGGRRFDGICREAGSERHCHLWPDVMSIIYTPKRVLSTSNVTALASFQRSSSPKEREPLEGTENTCRGFSKAEKELDVEKITEDLLLATSQAAEEDTFRACIQASIAMNKRRYDQKSTWLELSTFFQAIQRAYPQAEWLSAVNDLLFGTYYGTNKLYKKYPKIIFLAKYLCRKVPDEGSWISGDSALVKGQNVYLAPIEPVNLPAPVESVLKQFLSGSGRIDDHRKKYGQMLALAHKLLNKAKAQHYPILVVYAWNQSAAVLVQVDQYCRRGEMNYLIDQMGVYKKLDIVVLQNNGTWMEGTWSKEAQMEITASQDAKPLTVAISQKPNPKPKPKPKPKKQGVECQSESHTGIRTSSHTPSPGLIEFSASAASQRRATEIYTFDQVTPLYNRWVGRHPAHSTTLSLYHSLSRRLLQNLDTKTFKKLLKERIKKFNLTSEQTTGWIAEVQPFLKVSMEVQKKYPAAKPPEGWKVAGGENDFLPLLLDMELSRSAAPFPVELFRLPSDQARSYRDALYLVWFVMEQQKTVQLIGRDDELCFGQITLAPHGGGIRISPSSYISRTKDANVLWVTQKGYTPVVNIESSSGKKGGESHPSPGVQAVFLSPIQNVPGITQPGFLMFPRKKVESVNLGKGTVSQCPDEHEKSTDAGSVDVFTSQLESLSLENTDN